MRKILVVIDMQNDFVSGSLGSPEAQAIVPAVVKEIQNPEYDEIFCTLDTHKKDYLQSYEGKKLPVEHCIKNTAGWEFEENIKNALPDSARVFEKPAFGSVELAKTVAAENEDKNTAIYLCGLCTDICVISNALLLKAFLPEADIFVIAAACAGVSPKTHQNALEALSCCQINII